ncbi:MAG: MFS transporter [Bdellovibrionaceae bacterium]|nr:MFS transporter [Pseudobdellovibrionaceae bacterium]
MKYSARQKFSLFACLYFAQGLPYGFFTQALPVFLREAKTSLAMIGGTALLTLPWALKFTWAPLADRYGFKNYGLRKSWIVPLQLLSCLLLLGLSFLNPSEGLAPVLGAFLICNLVAAGQDVATDGLAVDLLKESEKGWANGIQVGGYRLGMIVGGSLMLIILSTVGWAGAMVTMSALLLASSIPVLLFKEKSQHISQHPPRAGLVLPAIRGFFNEPGGWNWVLILMSFKFAHQAGSSMMRPWLVDAGYSLEAIASLMGMIGSGAGLFGAMIGGFVAGAFKRPRSLIALAGLQALATSSYCLPIFSEHAIWKVGLATALDNGMSGIATVTLFAAMMDRCRPTHSASDYTLQASIVVISQTAATPRGGLSAVILGYKNHFLLVSAAAISVFLLCWRNVRQIGKHTAAAILFAMIFLSQTESAHAQDSSTGATEIGVGFGPFLPSRIGGVREILNGWALRGTQPTSKGTFELEWFNGHGSGTHYHSLMFDYRLDVLGDGGLEMLPVHFLIGLHADYYQPLEQPWRPSGGWHYGGGIRIPIGNVTALRAEFKHRFSPGQSMIVLVGVSFSFGGDSAAN